MIMAVIHLTKDNFKAQVMEADKPVLIDFYADWCGPCQMVSPIVEEIAGERSGVSVCKVNVDDERELAMSAGIESIPTLLVIQDGKVRARLVGYREKDALRREIEAAL